MCSAFIFGTTLWKTVTPRAELQGYWTSSLSAHRSCWDAGILGSAPSQLRADGGIDSQWFHSEGNNLEGTMWGSSGKEGFSTAGEELEGCKRGCADAREVEMVKERFRRALEKSHLFTYWLWFAFFPPFHKNLQDFFLFTFPFYSLVFGCL